MKTAVVILNWNGRKLLEQFLPPLISSCNGIARVVVADNASSDDSLKWMRTNYPDVQLISNASNEGYAGGYNTALKQVDAEYYLLLNSDVEVTADWMQILSDFMDRHPEIAVCQPKLRWFKHKNQFEYAGAAGGFIDMFGYPFCRGRIFGSIEQDEGQFEDSIATFWSSGACMMVRAAVFRETGGFDASFFAHMEEIDFCWRVLNKGYKVAVVPQAVVYHVGGATLPKNNPRKTFLNFRNNLTMLYKNLPALYLFPILGLRVILDIIAAFKFLLDGDGGDFLAVLKAHLAFAGRLITLRMKRTAPADAKLPDTVYRGSIVWMHYIRQVKTFGKLKFKTHSI